MATIAEAFAGEAERRGFTTSIRYDQKREATICEIQSKEHTTALPLGDGETVDDTRSEPIGLELWDFGVDPTFHKVDVRWFDKEGNAQSYSRRREDVDIAQLVDLVLGPES